MQRQNRTTVNTTFADLGVPARIVVFPEENHWILKAQSAKLWYAEVLGWLDRWLPDGN